VIAEADKLAAARKLPGGSSAPPQKLPPNFVQHVPAAFKTPTPLRPSKVEKGDRPRNPNAPTPEGLLKGLFGNVPKVEAQRKEEIKEVKVALNESSEQPNMANREQLMAALSQQAPVQTVKSAPVAPTQPSQPSPQRVLSPQPPQAPTVFKPSGVPNRPVAPIAPAPLAPQATAPTPPTGLTRPVQPVQHAAPAPQPVQAAPVAPQPQAPTAFKPSGVPNGPV